MSRSGFNAGGSRVAAVAITVGAAVIGIAPFLSSGKASGASAAAVRTVPKIRSTASPHVLEHRPPTPGASDGVPDAVTVADTSTPPTHRRHFDGRPIRPVRSMRMRVTAYSPDHRSCGMHADGITASGYSVEVNAGRLVAADGRLFPFGSLVSVPGYAGGRVVPVLDRGGAIKGPRLDVLHPTHQSALQWGVRHLDVVVWEYADGRPIGYRRPRGR